MQEAIFPAMLEVSRTARATAAAAAAPLVLVLTSVPWYVHFSTHLTIPLDQQHACQIHREIVVADYDGNSHSRGISNAAAITLLLPYQQPTPYQRR